MAKIGDALLDFNPWWKRAFSVEFKDREVYARIQPFIRRPQIIALTGLRRVGKTTILLKIVEDHVRNGLDPKRVVYFSFDEFGQAELREVVREYERISEKSLGDGKYIFLLDEIQKLDNWENQLKAIYDTFGKNVKIIISGSESLFIRKRSRETLAGRLFEFRVDPLSFKEFLMFKGATYEPVGLHEKELLGLFDEFILTCGFPELVGVREKDVVKKYIKESIVEKIIYRDLPELVRVKDISTISALLNIIMEEPGQIIDISNLANDLKISRQTASTYLSYLEDSFLIRKLYNYSKNRRKVERKLKRYYPIVVSVDLLFREDELSRSKIFEWLVVNELKAEFFWRDPYKHEVDIVIANGKPIPIEIKYGKLDFEGLLVFMEKFRIDKGHVVSYRSEEEKEIRGKKISVLPAFKFLLGKSPQPSQR